MKNSNNNWCASLHNEDNIYCDNFLYESPPLFESIDLKAGEYLEREDIKLNAIGCLLSGELEISTRGAVCHKIESGNMLLVPIGDNIHVKALTDCSAMICRFTNEMSVCGRYYIDHLLKKVGPNIKSRPKRGSIFMLPINDMLVKELEIIRSMINSGRACMHYQKLKKDTLFIEMRSLYPIEQLYKFLSPIIGNDINFKYRVLEIYQQVETAQELNDLLNMSATTFKHKFKETFGMTARQWLISKKEQKIIRDIIMTNMTAAELADKYNFTNNYITTFCRNRFGKSLTELRLIHSGGG